VTRRGVADRVARVVEQAADVELHPCLGQLLDDVAGIRQGTREPVEFRHDKRVAGAARREGFAQSGPSPVGAGQAVVDIDPVRLDAQRGERAALGGEVLGISRAAAYPTSILATGRP